MRTFNARIYSGKDVVEIRENLSASQVCDFAREVSGRGVEKNTSLLIEQLVARISLTCSVVRNERRHPDTGTGRDVRGPWPANQT